MPKKASGTSTKSEILNWPLSSHSSWPRISRTGHSPPEVNRLGRTIARWATQITNWHHSAVTNGPTEALNNLIKRIKRAAFGFRNFAKCRIRALLYAGKPNWHLLTPSLPTEIR